MGLHVLASKLRPRFGAGVAALIFDAQGRVLLFKHTYRKFQWGLPAGGLEFREKPAEAIVREFFEETGMRIKVEKLLTVVNAQEARYVTIIYLCKIISGDFKPSFEVSEIKYFAVDDLPKMLLAEKAFIRQFTNYHLPND